MNEHSSKELLTHFQEYLIRQGMSPATVKNYLADINAFAQWYRLKIKDDTLLLSFSALDLRAFCSEMSSNGLSPNSVNRRLQALRKFGQFALESGLRDHNPAHDVARLRSGQRKPPRILTNAQADDLLETVLAKAKASQAKRDYAIIITLLTCGIRLRELVDLRLEDVELKLDEGYLMIGPSAAEGGRVIPFGMAPTAALKDYLRARPNVPGENHLFLNREGRSISPRTVQRLITRYVQASGLKDVSAQTLRTTFAHAMLKGIKDIETVSKLLGHSSTATTIRYFEHSHS